MPWRGPRVPKEFPTLGHVALQWIRDTLPIPDGPKMGQPFQLYPEQQKHVLRKYRLDPNAPGDIGNDAFQYGGSMVVRGQKWGKDPILSALDLFHAFGPCDFAGWDANGEPVGRPHPSPWVAVAALNDDQANNTWLPLKAMVEASELADYPGVDVTLDKIRLPCGNPVERLTTTAVGRLGGRFTKVSLTENGLMTDTVKTGASGGQRSPLTFAQTLIRSTDGMNGMWTAATNTWDPTERSHAQRVYEAKDPHILIDARIARTRVELDDDEALQREIIYLYGDSLRERGGHVSSQRITRSVRDKSKLETERRRFFLSEILSGEQVLCPTEKWAAFSRPSVLAPGEAVALGFDGSRARDKTTLTATRISDGRVFHLRTFSPKCMCEKPDHPPAACTDLRVDRKKVDEAVTNAFDGYKVWYLYGDPYKWGEYMSLWAARWPGKVVEVPTNVQSRMDAILDLFLVARDNDTFTHSGDADLTQHVADAVIAKGTRKATKPRVGADGQVIEHYLKVVKRLEGVFIDAAISMLLSYAARAQAIEDGALQDKPPPAPEGISEDADHALGASHAEFGDAVDWNNIPL
ncbi:hypothetical protein [Nocardioides lianchengensis]|uniref:Phage terminase-like protein, large subunit, contains N-terminal HTH domain n=1 Tax=Nocardioides lianchengensis TaxID=1045774 RepID=A0A1G6LR73_9ACTN|nr:hypothetical protein [Nocardioides lianchengensis]NYG12468.1 hypothetical protein [Nocardioides lianchengensis]SDC45778.1 hypothetical protein SAMN05421872_102336 [Nocardioides lianchengensis]